MCCVFFVCRLNFARKVVRKLQDKRFEKIQKPIETELSSIAQGFCRNFARKIV